MNRQRLRIFLGIVLLLASAFAAWGWLRPYAWREDPAARAKVAGVLVTRDQSYFWVEAHLKMNPGEEHDLRQAVFLETPGGKLDPADTTFGGREGEGTTDLWFKFWLDERQASGPLALHLNEGVLSIRTRQQLPALEGSSSRYFTTNQW
ncbi:MAG: hypothetical protein WED15_07715 [Akkermansiaceae bacterium]